MNFELSQEGMDLIASFEGCRLTAYKLQGEQYYTIGFGHYGADVSQGMSITMEQAKDLFKKDLKKYEAYVVAYCRWPDMWQGAYDMLVSFAYNRGAGSLSRVAAKYNSAIDMINAFPENWGTATTYKNALIKRREREKAFALKSYVPNAQKPADNSPYLKSIGNTLIDALNNIGIDSSFQNRKKIYEAQIYEGTAEQNTYLLEALRNGRLKRP